VHPKYTEEVKPNVYLSEMSAECLERAPLQKLKDVECACHLLRRLVRGAETVRLVKESEEEIHLFLKLNSSTKNERVFCFALSSLTPLPPTLLSVVGSGMITVKWLNFGVKNHYLNV